MKLLTYINLSILTATLSYANTTMCFKENHKSMSTIESTKLDGGECKSTFTVNQMKEKGWVIDDIKITTKKDTYSFIYIFKNKVQNTPVIPLEKELNEAELEAKIIKKIEAKNLQKIKEEKLEKIIKEKIDGKKIYIAQCQLCHGKSGELEAMNASRPLNTLSYEDMQDSIDNYINDKDFGNGRQFVMKPYASSVSDKELINIHQYLKSLKK